MRGAAELRRVFTSVTSVERPAPGHEGGAHCETGEQPNLRDRATVGTWTARPLVRVKASGVGVHYTQGSLRGHSGAVDSLLTGLSGRSRAHTVKTKKARPWASPSAPGRRAGKAASSAAFRPSKPPDPTNTSAAYLWGR